MTYADFKNVIAIILTPWSLNLQITMLYFVFLLKDAFWYENILIFVSPDTNNVITNILCFSHSVQWFSLWDVYRYQPISHSSCSLNCNVWQLCHIWLDRVRKYKRCSFFVRYIWWNIAHFQWIRCSSKGSHLIHWTSAVFSHIALKWTLFAYHTFDMTV